MQVRYSKWYDRENSVLKLDFTEIKESELKDMISFIELHPEIKSLICINVYQQAAFDIVDAITLTPNLHALSITGDYPSEATKELAKKLEKLSSLDTLSMSSSSGLFIMYHLQHLTKLRSLSLSSENFTHDIAYFASELEKLTLLQSLYLSFETITDKEAAFIAEATSHLKELRIFSISGNGPNDSTAILIAKITVGLPNIQSINIDGPNISKQGKKDITCILAQLDSSNSTNSNVQITALRNLSKFAALKQIKISTDEVSELTKKITI